MQSAAGPVWIDPAWLSWESYWDTKDPVPNDGTIRLYEIHQHACDRLASDPSEFDRIDAIITLRRVVAMRVKALKDTYQLRELPIDECLMFADLVWYLLRSTDGLARMQVESLIFKPDGMTSRVFQNVMLHFGEPFSKPPKISSLLHASIIINGPKENWIKIEPVELDRLESHGDFWISISGKVCGTDEQMRLIYDTYFRTSHLGGLCR
jgi:hypothetical protein